MGKALLENHVNISHSNYMNFIQECFFMTEQLSQTPVQYIQTFERLSGQY